MLDMLLLNPRQQISPRQLLLHSPTSSLEEIMGRVKTRELLVEIKFNRKTKSMHTNKAKQGILSLLPTCRQVFRHLQKSRALSHVNWTWINKCHHSKHPPFPPSLTCFIYRAQCHNVWKNPLDQFESPVPAVSPPNSQASPTSLPAQQYKRKKRSWLCVSKVQQQQKHLCIIKPVFSKKPKHSPMPATVKKINFFLSQNEQNTTLWPNPAAVC